jgi:RHS repeat-associated protein
VSSAAKFGDPILGIDVHMVMCPPFTPANPAGVPTPLPHPFIGIVFDPIGAAIGALMGGGPVFVNGKATGNTGTDVEAVSKHQPTKPGVVWAPNDLPSDDGTLILGSKTVHFAGASQSRFGSAVMTCNFPVNLPTSVCMAVPTGNPVNIGGPDAVDYLAAATRAIRTKWVSDKAHDLLKAGKGGARSKVICFLTGHPVDVVTGELIAEATDFSVPGLIPVVWERNYRSRQTQEGPLGPGWYHPYHEWIEDTSAGPRLFLGDGRLLRDDYPPLAFGERHWDGEERFTLVRTRAGFERRCLDGRTFLYAQLPDAGRRFRLVRIEDACANAVLLDYERGYLVRVTDTAGRVFSVLWTRRGRIASVTFEGQPLIRYEYDEHDALVAAVDPLGHAQRYAYRGGVMVQETTKRGVSFFFEWDWENPEGWCVRTWGDDQGNTIYDRRILYDKHRHITRVEDGRGGVTMYWGNALGLVDKTMDPMGGYTEYTWDAECRKTSETNPLGHRHEWVYDRWGNCIEESDAVGNVTRRGYDTRHQLVRLEEPHADDEAPVVWRLGYEPQGVVHWISDPLGHTTVYAHDARGRLVGVDAPAGRSQRLAWTARHELGAVTDGENRTERFGYDALGRLSWSEDTAGRRTRAQRDACGRVTHLERGDGQRFTMSYDPDGNPVAQVDSQGRRVEMRYFGTGQLAEHVDPMGYHVRFDYDTEEDLAVVVNQIGEHYRFERDKAGRLHTEIGFDGKRTRHLHDQAGRPVRTLAPGRLVTEIARDPLGRITERNSRTMPGDTTVERFAYDARGHLASATNDDVELRFARDPLGRVVREECRRPNGAAGTVTSRFDDGGLRVERETTFGHRARYAWDKAGRLASVSAGHGGFVPSGGVARLPLPQLRRSDWSLEIERDAAGEEVARRMPGGVVATSKRDAYGKPTERRVLTGTRSDAPGRDVMRREYSWRGPEQIGALLDTFAHTCTSFDYDDRGHLIRQTLPNGEPLHRQSDAAANLFRTPDMSDAQYAPGGVLLSARGADYKHDHSGNLVEKQLADGATWRYRWDHEGRLVEVERPDGKKVTFAYDPLGRRIEKRFDGTVTEYLWDGDTLAHERIRDAEGAPFLLRSWVHDQEGCAPVLHQEAAERFSFVTDILGVVSMLIDDTGNVATSHELDVYGSPQGLDPNTDPSTRFAGQWLDPETGLFYNRHRYYDPETGRYISQDPIGLDGGLNPYSYVYDTLLWSDPLGLIAKPGEPLYVGSYSTSKYWNKKTGLNPTYTPHHAIPDAVSPTSHGKGITINLPKHIHELTETYKRSRHLASLRDHLASDAVDLRKLLRGAGYDPQVVREQVSELISKNKEAYGDHLKRGGCK